MDEQQPVQPHITIVDHKETNLGKYCIILTGKDANCKQHTTKHYCDEFTKSENLKIAEKEFKKHIESGKCLGCHVETKGH